MAAATVVPLTRVRPHKRVLITANKGGCGKSTTAVHVATAAAQAGYDVVGLDLEPQRNFAKWSRRRPTNMPPVPVIEGSLTEFEFGLARAKNHDVVVIDTPPGVGEMLPTIEKLVQQSDIVVVPTGTGIFDLESIVPWSRALSKVKSQPVSFVLNRIDARVLKTDYREAIAALRTSGEIVPNPVRDLIDIERFMKGGISVADQPKHNGRDDVVGVWDHIALKLWPNEIGGTRG